MADILPCPFYKQVPVLCEIEKERWESIYYIFCANCATFCGDFPSKEEAVRRWNERGYMKNKETQK